MEGSKELDGRNARGQCLPRRRSILELYHNMHHTCPKQLFADLFKWYNHRLIKPHGCGFYLAQLGTRYPLRYYRLQPFVNQYQHRSPL